MIDPANLLVQAMRPIACWRLSHEAFDWLGPDIVLAHAKNPTVVPRSFRPATCRISRRCSTGRSSAIGRDHRTELNAKLANEEGTSEVRRAVRWLPFYRHYFVRLASIGYAGPLIMHGLEEPDVAGTAELSEIAHPGRQIPS